MKNHFLSRFDARNLWKTNIYFAIAVVRTPIPIFNPLFFIEVSNFGSPIKKPMQQLFLAGNCCKLFYQEMLNIRYLTDG
jgi:hypothetical protein